MSGLGIHEESNTQELAVSWQQDVTADCFLHSTTNHAGLRSNARRRGRAAGIGCRLACQAVLACKGYRASTAGQVGSGARRWYDKSPFDVGMLRSGRRRACCALGTRYSNPMGYDLHITRASSWLERAEQPISPAEWQSIVDADATLTPNATDYFQRTGPSGQVETIHPVDWTEGNDGNCLWYVDGVIECKNPSHKWISKMVEIAARLDAKVLGEGNEEYTQ